jgi:hypothetical protein
VLLDQLDRREDVGQTIPQDLCGHAERTAGKARIFAIATDLKGSAAGQKVDASGRPEAGETPKTTIALAPASDGGPKAVHGRGRLGDEEAH